MTLYRSHNYATILRGLKAKDHRLEQHNDAAILEAWDAWSLSSDHPDETKIVEWIGAPAEWRD